MGLDRFTAAERLAESRSHADSSVIFQSHEEPCRLERTQLRACLETGLATMYTS